jgi:DNA (cytosine-5)-methyltransferase 1
MSKKTYTVVDMFCGAGGESTGIMQAAQERGMKVDLLAINHWETAMNTHAANHPGAEHLCESVERIDPTQVIKGGKLNLLWASPECTHHSVARGGRPRSDQGRASAWSILKWLSELYVERVIIENVPEFLSWGPLDRQGRPMKSRKGDIFRAFISSLQSLGYAVDWKILCAADYGDPTTRRRLFIQAVKGRKRIMWPQATHAGGDADPMGCQPWRPARDIIDWTIPGTSIFDRKKPLADSTIRRIAAGIEKYWKDYAQPFLAVLYGTSTVKPLDEPLTAISCIPHHAIVTPVPLIMGHESGQAARPVDRPVHTVLAQGKKWLIQPFITRYQGSHAGQKDGENRNYEIERPLPTLDTSNRYGLVESSFILPNEGFYRGNPARSIDDPLNTVTSRGAGALVESFVICTGHSSAKDRSRSIDEPLSTVVTKAEHCLVEPGNVGLDIRFRMLKNHELKRAQGFPDDYILKGNSGEQTRQIGNAVPVNTARALAAAAMGV